MKNTWIILALFTLLLANCKTNPEVQTNPNQEPSALEQSVLQYANESFKDGYDLMWNQSKSAVIIAKKLQNQQKTPFPAIQIAVFDVTKGEAVLEEKIARGTIEWIDDDEIRIARIPGQVRDRNTDQNLNTYIFNWKKQVKRQLK